MLHPWCSCFPGLCPPSPLFTPTPPSPAPRNLRSLAECPPGFCFFFLFLFSHLDPSSTRKQPASQSVSQSGSVQFSCKQITAFRSWKRTEKTKRETEKKKNCAFADCFSHPVLVYSSGRSSGATGLVLKQVVFFFRSSDRFFFFLKSRC